MGKYLLRHSHISGKITSMGVVGKVAYCFIYDVCINKNLDKKEV